jgi:hypothetical protein
MRLTHPGFTPDPPQRGGLFLDHRVQLGIAALKKYEREDTKEDAKQIGKQPRALFPDLSSRLAS